MKRLSVFTTIVALVLSISSCSDKTADYLRSAKRSINGKEWVNLNLSYDYYNVSGRQTANYSVYIHNGKNDPYYVLYSTTAMLYTKVGKNELLMVDDKNRELTRVSKSGNEDVFRQFAYETDQTILNYIPFYFVGLPFGMWKSYTPKVDEVNEAAGIKEYVYSRHYQELNRGTDEFGISLRKECHTWVNSKSLRPDSVAVFTIYKEEEPMRRYSEYYYVQSLDNEDVSAFLDSVFDFDNPRYSGYTRHTESFLPSSRTMSRCDTLNTSNLTYPIVSLSTGDTTCLADTQGWILLDMWQFGCPPCDDGFRRFSNERDSLGCTIAEKDGIKILSANTRSDNTELLARYAEAFHCSDLIYHSKGLQAELSVNAFPTYYLISPDKQIVWRGNRLGDYSELLKAKEDYEKSLKTD